MSAPDWPTILDRYRDGESATAIASDHDVSPESIRSRATRDGVIPGSPMGRPATWGRPSSLTRATLRSIAHHRERMADANAHIADRILVCVAMSPGPAGAKRIAVALGEHHDACRYWCDRLVGLGWLKKAKGGVVLAEHPPKVGDKGG